MKMSKEEFVTRVKTDLIARKKKKEQEIISFLRNKMSNILNYRKSHFQKGKKA